VRIENFIEIITPQVGMSHDARDEVSRITKRLSGNELCFTHWSKMRRTVLAVTGTAFNKYCLFYEMACCGITVQLVESVGQ
jgi:hypothetical protein